MNDEGEEAKLLFKESDYLRSASVDETSSNESNDEHKKDPSNDGGSVFYVRGLSDDFFVFRREYILAFSVENRPKHDGGNQSS